jgi:Flp pilus assembly protein TadD
VRNQRLPLFLTLGAGLTLGLLAGCATDPNAKPGGGAGLDRPEVARSLLDAATMAAAQGDHATAATYYRNVYLRDPGNSRAALGLMRSLREAGDLDQARQVADAVQLAKPNDAPVLAEVGKVRLASGQLQPAVLTLQRAAELDPADWRTRSALGVAHDRLGDRPKAEENYRAALALSPDNPLILNNLALSRAMANDLAGARELLQRAVATSRADLRVRQNLALVYALSGNMAQAEALTLQDLPPEMARETLAYYRELANQAQPR